MTGREVVDVQQTRAAAGSFRLSPTTLRAWERTVACARILHATAIVLQCPRSFRPTAQNATRMEELERLRAMPPVSGIAYVLSDNIPRVVDAERFQALLRAP